jgi:hypothetical protein
VARRVEGDIRLGTVFTLGHGHCLSST